MTERSSQLHLGVVWLVLATVPTVLMVVFLEGWEMWQWARSGLCPGMAPDIWPEPCTWSEFRNRGWGAWELAGAVVYACGTLVFATWCVAGWAGDRWLRRRRQELIRMAWLMGMALPVMCVVLFQLMIYGALALFYAAPPMLVLAALARRSALTTG